MATIRAILDTRTKKQDGTYPLKLSLAHDAKTSFISLGISVEKTQWNGLEVIDHPKSKNYNRLIKNRLVLAESDILKLSSDGRLSRMTHKNLKQLIEFGDETPVMKSLTLRSNFEKYISNLRNARTKQIYQETMDKIIKYDPEVTFDEVNLSWLRSFDSYMADSCATNTRSIHMRNIRAVFNSAIDEDLVSYAIYPFRKFKIKSERTIKQTLSIDQIKQFRDYPVEKHQERYRDLFMLIFYTIGTNLVDLLHLKHSDLRNERIEYIRAKTGKEYSIEVLPEALAIIKRYQGKKYLLNVMDDYQNYKDFGARMNENLKEIGIQTRKGRGGKITRTPLFPDLIIYTARRSWATIASGLEIPKETISAGLGHGGNSVTDIYINFDMKKVDQANRIVLASIK